MLRHVFEVQFVQHRVQKFFMCLPHKKKEVEIKKNLHIYIKCDETINGKFHFTMCKERKKKKNMEKNKLWNVTFSNEEKSKKRSECECSIYICTLHNHCPNFSHPFLSICNSFLYRHSFTRLDTVKNSFFLPFFFYLSFSFILYLLCMSFCLSKWIPSDAISTSRHFFLLFLFLSHVSLFSKVFNVNLFKFHFIKAKPRYVRTKDAQQQKLFFRYLSTRYFILIKKHTHTHTLLWIDKRIRRKKWRKTKKIILGIVLVIHTLLRFVIHAMSPELTKKKNKPK